MEDKATGTSRSEFSSIPNRVLRFRSGARTGATDPDDQSSGTDEQRAGGRKEFSAAGTQVVELDSRLYLLTPLHGEINGDLPFALAASNGDEFLGLEALSDRFRERDDEIEPVAASLFDLISSSQIRIARRLGRTIGINVDDEAGRLFGLRLGELSRRAAEKMISHLESVVCGQTESLRQAS